MLKNINYRRETMQSIKKMLYNLYPCYFSFFVNGMMVLMVGAVLPYLIQEAGITYGVAGGFLSTFAIGNLLASFINPVWIGRFGRKATVTMWSACIPIGLLLLTVLPPVPVIYIIFIFVGIGRGSVSIFNNAVVNDENPGNPIALNILHTIFALGAFLAPFITSLFIAAGFNWRVVVYTVSVLCMIAIFLFNRIKATSIQVGASIKVEKSKNQENGYLKKKEFYIVGAVLFFYLGIENCVNGWFITYFKSIGIMSEMYAANLVTIVWIMVMLGRLTTAYLSKFMNSRKLIFLNCIGTCIFFFLLISTKNLVVITTAIVGLGFFLAGIYPTSVSEGGEMIRGSRSGMSILLAMAALGGIITPQIVGLLADSYSLEFGITFLVVSMIGMVLGAAILLIKRERTGKM